MAQQWIRVSASSAGLVLLLQLALSVLTFGDGGVCPNYPVDPTWKDSMSAQEMKSKKLHLSLVGTFEQGVNVLLNRPPEDSVANEVQEVKMVVRTVYPSDSRGVYKVNVILTLGFRRKHSPFELISVESDFEVRSEARGVKIIGDGTFDEATGELCVLGCILSLCNCKLRLKYPAPKTILDVSIRGDLTSVGAFGDKTYFDPISLHAFDDAPFQYSRNATLASVCSSLAPDVEVGKLWNVDGSDEVCSPGWYPRTFWDSFEVSWNPECDEANCGPFAELGNTAGGNTSTLRFLEPSCVGNRVQATLDFTNPYSSSYKFMDPSASDGTLRAEGIWDSKTRQMCMIACHLYGFKQDCEIAITLQLPLTFTVMQRSSVVGHIQSLRKETDPLYFKRITFRHNSYFRLSSTLKLRSDFSEEAGFKEATNKPEYVYTKVETAKAQCANLNDLEEEKKKKNSFFGNYPSGENWRDFSRFKGVKDILSSQIHTEYYEMNILTRGNEFMTTSFGQLHYNGANVTGLGVTGSAVQAGIMNVSYSMNYQIGPRKGDGESMAGEGVYDSNTGKICLIGCRAVDLKLKGLQQLEGDAQKDCQTFFSLQLPRIGSTEGCKGTLKSLRPPTDPLYFKPESLSGCVYMQAEDLLSWQEVVLRVLGGVLMPSLTVVFVSRQLVYSKRHPETLPYISIFMLKLLYLAYMIAMVVDLEPGSMVSMLLQLRLLQLVTKSRTEARVTGQLTPAVQEGRLLYYILPLYIAGGLIAILVHAMVGFKPYERAFLWQSGLAMWWDLQAYGGLLVDLHLLPQVIANILWDATEQAPLSKWFYMGMALVRSVPHLYDLCRQFRFIPSFSDMYPYANPEWGFYSMTSDILIPFFVVLLAIMVSMQQRWGGRCVLPRRWRNHLQYENVENPIAP